MLGICSLSILVFHETLFLLVLMYGSETMLWKEKERSRIRAVQMNNPGGLLGTKWMNSPKCLDKGVVWNDEGVR